MMRKMRLEYLYGPRARVGDRWMLKLLAWRWIEFEPDNTSSKDTAYGVWQTTAEMCKGHAINPEE